MSVIISRNISLGGGGVVDTSDNPRILVENVFTLSNATVTASEEVGSNNGWLENAIDGLTFDYWQVTTYPAWLEVTLTEARPVDMCAIGLHSGLDYVFQYWDGSAWVNLHTAVTATTTAVEAVIFDEVTATKFRIYITGAVGDKILGICMLGKSLQLPKRFYGGHGPVTLNRTSQVIRNTTEGGYDAGVYHIRTGAATSVEVTNMQPAWIRENIETLNRQLERQPFVFAWRPATFPDDVAYCWLDAPIRAVNGGPKDLMSLQFDFHAFVGGDALPSRIARYFFAYQVDPWIESFLVTDSDLLIASDPDLAFSGTLACNSISTHPAGLVALASNTEGVRVFEFANDTWELIQDEFTGLTSIAEGVSIYPDDARYMLVNSWAAGIKRVSLYERTTVGGVNGFYLLDYAFGSTGDASVATFSPDGTMISHGLLSSVYTYQFNPDTAAITFVESLAIGSFTKAVAWSPDSNFLAITNNSASPRFAIYKRDPADDTMTAQTIDLYFPKSIPNSANNVGWHPDSGLVVVGSAESESSIYIYQDNGDDTFSDVTDTILDSQLGIGGKVFAVEWSKAGDYLVAGISDFGGSGNAIVVYSYDGETLTRLYDSVASKDILDIKSQVFSGSLTDITIDNSTADENTLEADGGATLSSGDLNAAIASSAQTARSVEQLRGKRYIEFNNSWNGLMIGVCNAENDYGWNDTAVNSGHYFVANGNNFDKLTGGSAASSPTDLIGDWCGIAIDTLNRKLWLRDKTGTFWDGDPEAGTGGWSFTALAGNEIRLSLGNGTGSGNVTINFGSTAFTHAVPEGFNE